MAELTLTSTSNTFPITLEDHNIILKAQNRY